MKSPSPSFSQELSLEAPPHLIYSKSVTVQAVALGSGAQSAPGALRRHD